MLKKLVAKIKEVFRRMRLTAYKDINQIQDLPIEDEFYKLIEMWKEIYQGQYKEWNYEQINTINGGKNQRKETLNMAKIVSQELATLVFNERCEISTDNDDLTEHINAILEENAFDTKFQNYLEYQFSMGGMVIKPFMNPRGKLQLSYVTADNFIPIKWDNKNIYEAVFPSTTTKRDVVYTLLEWHLWEDDTTYLVRNELYKAEKNSGELGRRVPLEELYPDLEEETRIDDLEVPLFVYFHPASANNIDTSNPLGVPVYAHVLPTLKAINDIYNSYMREFRLGKRRIIVPTSAVQAVPDQETGTLRRYFDADDEVYEAMDIGDMDQNKIQDNSVSLRVQEHIEGLNHQLNILAAACGFSAGTFTFDAATGLKTATEVVSENSKTFRTKQSHENVVEDKLKQLIAVIVQMADLYDIFPTPNEEYEVSVQFDDSIAEDKDAETNREILLVKEKLSTRVKALMKIHGITEEEAIKLKKEIDEEAATAQQEALDFFGRAGANINVGAQEDIKDDDLDE